MKYLVSSLLLMLLMTAGAVYAKEKGGASSKATTNAAASSALIDINTATGPELEKLPGIGQATSAKIIAGRPYSSKAQLKTKGIVTDNVYGKIADKIIAKQASK